MNKENSDDANHSVIIVPETGKIILRLEDGGCEVELTAEKLEALHLITEDCDAKTVLDSLRKGFMEICKFKMSGGPGHDDLFLPKQFVDDYYEVCRFFETWSGGAA